MDNLTQNSNISSENNCQRLANLMDKVLGMARRSGALQAEVTASVDQGYSIDVRLNEVEKVESSRDKGVGITVYFGQKKGMASTTDTSEQSLQKAVDAACDIAKASSEDPCFGLAAAELMAKEYPDLELHKPWVLTPEQAIELGLNCESLAMQQDKRIVNSEGVNVSSYQFCRAYANSHGFNGYIESSRHAVSCVLIAQDEQGMQRDYDYTTARRPEDLIPIEQLAIGAANKTLARLGAKKVKTQSLPVLFTADVSNTLINSFIAAVSGNNLYRKNSYLLNGIDSMVFPEFISIYEQPHLKHALGSSPYDGDGLLTRDNLIVDKGRLNQYVLGTYSARRLGLASTANSGGVHNLTVSDSAKNTDELVQMMDKGIVVTELMGQGVNVTTGDYSRGASGFWVERGEIQYPIEEFTVAGNLRQMCERIIAVGNDWDRRKSTRCGSLLVESMMVAGQ